MTEQIELRTFSNNQLDETSENAIEEYHDTNQRAETVLSLRSTENKIKSYDFFTSHDVKSALSNTLKKKKKKKGKSTLMDIITSELSSLTIPIEENVITFVKSDYRFVEEPSYLKSNLKEFNRRRYFPTGSTHLVPQFPNLSLKTLNYDSLPVAYVKPVRFENTIAESNGNIEKSARFLEIEIIDIKIRHHHKFTLEHLLAVALQEHYIEYKRIESLCKELERDIEVNRETKDCVKEDLLMINAKEVVRLDATVRKYTGILLQLKEKYYELIKRRKDVVHNIVSLWSDIQSIREKSEATLTPYAVDIINKQVREEDLQKEWNKIFKVEYTDMLSKIEYEYVGKYLEYKKTKCEKNKDSAKTINKPKLEFDENVIKTKVEEIVNEISIRNSIDVVFRSDEHTIVNRPFKLTYSFKIYVDDIFVCESEQYTISVVRFFNIELNESLLIQILPYNTSLIIVLSENDTNIAFYKIYLNEICNSNNNSQACSVKFKLNDIIKPNNKYVGSGYTIKEIVANKIRLKSSSLFKSKLYTNYDVNLKLGWNEKLNKTKAETIKSYVNIDKQINRIISGNTKPDFELMTDLIDTVYNKNINEDENMINTLRHLCKINYLVSNDKFKITESNPEINRFKLLRLREKSGFNDIKHKAIPIFASQLSTVQLNCLQRSNENVIDLQLLNNKYSEMDPIEVQRLVGIKYIQKLNKNVLYNLNEFFLRKTNKDVVKDFSGLSLRGLFFNKGFTSLATLSSVTKQQILNDALSKEQEIYVTVIRAFNLLDRTCSILLEDKDDDEKIAGVKIRPVRPFVKLSYRDVKEQTTVGIGCHPTWNQTLKFKIIPEPLSSIHVNIYDEHRIVINESYPEEDQSFHSRTVHYRYYNKWLGTVKVPIYNVFALGSVHETFKISTPPLVIGYENSQYKDSTHSLIPEVTQMLKKESPFICLQITTSLSHLGKVQGYSQPVPNNSEDDYVIKHLNNFVTDYTNDFPSRNICLAFIDSSGKNTCVTQFLQPIPPPDSKFFPKTKCRSESAKSKSSGKSSSSRDSRKNVDIEKGVPSNEEEEKESIYSVYDAHWRSDDAHMSRIMNGCLRYVSLIPTYEVTESHVVSLRGLELLKILNGSLLDHTILLASYFLYLGVKFWVAIGLGVPYGVSSYVLTKYDHITHKVAMVTDQGFRNRSFLSKSDSHLWHVYDAVNGEKYELRDVSCPLKTIDYIFNNENIWVNMQSSQNCEKVSFNFSKTSEWQPVFDKSIFIMRLPIVNDSNLYSLLTDVEKLRQIIESKVKNKIQKWRSNVKTVWNRYCSSLLREVLPCWEGWSFNPSEPRPGLGQKLKQLMVTYQMYGLPLNVPYVSTKSVISTIKSTGVHANDDPTVEFGLAVELYAYPNNVLSVWVFLASICKIEV